MIRVLLMLLVGSAYGQDPLRVRLFWLTKVEQVKINGEVVKAPLAAKKVFAAPVRIERPGTPGYVVDAPVEVTAGNGRLLITALMPVEPYVASVLAGETNGVRSEEALKAMAVAIRTYAIRFRHAHRAEGFDLCDTSHCQDVHVRGKTLRHDAIAEATEGLLLWWKGEPAATYYHAHNGGRSEGSPHGPYLAVKDDPYSMARGNEQWRSAYTPQQVAQALGGKTPVSELVIGDRSASGRVKSVTVEGRRWTGTQFQMAMGRQWGWGIKSLLFDVHEAGGKWVFTGRGRGHGVGMSQIGAIRMGEQGKTMKEILEFYYPGTKLGLTAQGLDWQARRGARLEMFSTEPEVDEAALRVAEAALAEAERRAGMKLTGKGRLRVYPTVAAYRNATGEAGTVAASTRGATVRMQPMKVLEGRGVLESILLHEMVHVVLEGNTRVEHPWWFREGLALELAGDEPGSAEYRAARDRVRKLIAERGREGVLRLWREGGASATGEFQPRGDVDRKGERPTKAGGN